MLVDQIYEIHALKETVVVHTEQIKMLTAERKHITVGAWLVNRGHALSTPELANLGKMMANYCRNNGVATGKCQQAQYKVKTYPINSLEHVLGETYPDCSEVAFNSHIGIGV